MKMRWILALAVGLWAAPVNSQEKGAPPDEQEKADPAKAEVKTEEKVNPAGEAPKAVTKEDLKTMKEKASYGIGLSIGKNFKSQGVDIDLNLLVKGIQDALSGGKALLTEAEVREVMQAFQKEMMAKQAERAKVIGEKNKKEGEAFLAENRSKPGVETLPSGLQYKVIEAGDGPKPKATDTVTTHYKGTLIDGTEFDSSYSRGEPATFRVNGVIKGWGEALQLMPVGAKWQLFVPSNLAYGERGAGNDIGPNAMLIFEVQLIGIKGS